MPWRAGFLTLLGQLTVVEPVTDAAWSGEMPAQRCVCCQARSYSIAPRDVRFLEVAPTQPLPPCTGNCNCLWWHGLGLPGGRDRVALHVAATAL